MGKVLNIDLTHSKAHREALREDWLESFIGESGLRAKYLCEMTTDDFIKTGERIFNLKRLYNVRLGISRKNDALPLRHLTFKRMGQGLTPTLPPFGQMLSETYDYRGWSENGIPTPEKLKELGWVT